MRRCASFLVAVAGFSGALVGPTQVAGAQEAATNSDQTALCESAAAGLNFRQWLCIGDRIQNLADPQSEPARVPGATTEQIGRPRFETLGAGDEDDLVCENVATCFQRRNDYISRVKGNAAYGDANGAIGSFDIWLGVNLNGRSPRFDYKFIWDSGPILTFDSTSIECVDENSGTISGSCGSYSGTGTAIISEGYATYQSPLINGAPLEDIGAYYAQIFSAFTPEGHPRQSIAPLTTERWKCPELEGARCTFAF